MFWKALSEKGGAIDIIGDVYFRDIYDELKESKHTVDLLRYFTEVDGFSVSFNKFLKDSGSNEEGAKKAFTSLVDSGLVSFESRRDEYQLKYSSFAYWFTSNYPSLII